MDGDILISLKEKHTPTAKLIAMLRRELPALFLRNFSSSFNLLMIVDQVLSFGNQLLRLIDVSNLGPDQDAAFALASENSTRVEAEQRSC